MYDRIKQNLQKKLYKLPQLIDPHSGLPDEMPAIPSEIQIFHRVGKELNTKYKFFHDRYILVIPLKGRGRAVIDEEIFQLSDKCGVLIFPNQTHRFIDISDDASWLFVSFKIIYGNNILEPMREKIFILNVKTLSLARQMVKTFSAAAHGSITDAKEIVFSLGSLLNHILSLDSDMKSFSIYRLDYSDFQKSLLKKANAYILDHISKPLTVKHISKHLNISESLIRNLFREKLGVSLGKFIKYKKMHKAASLLRSSEMNISEIALKCGYSSVYTFSRAFSLETEMSPLQFRKKSRL